MHQFAKVEELAQLVDVSEITVRRDINELDEKGLVHKV
ncbi:DeoR family transcriptional regulator, partial [Erysipelothrix rhusiopathiae]|nr:DeoR family transcriptional regulator [Erysipelothrix rhusiopathiae]